MKRIHLFALGLLFITASCHRKIAPDGDGTMGKTEKNEKSEKHEEKDEKPEASFGNASVNTDARPKESLEMGKTIYTTKCIKCHEAKSPGAFSKDEWTNILKAMIPKAKLNDVESRSVTAYVMSNAK